MRRSDLQLLALARQGDALAKCEVGRRYLRGGDGFPKNVRTGLEHLTHLAVRGRPEALTAISEGLALDELLDLGHIETLRRAAACGCTSAQVKLGVWQVMQPDGAAAAHAWFSAAAAAGDPDAAAALSLTGMPYQQRMAAVLSRLSKACIVDGMAITLHAADDALRERDLNRLCACLDCALRLPNPPRETLAVLVLAAVKLAIASSQEVRYLTPEQIQSSLELCVEAGDVAATYLLGCALAGNASACAGGKPLVHGPNLRAAAALLLRAAHGGEDRAWLDLYRLHSDHRCSVANAQLSQFFLEKAAETGHPDAQRVLGGLLLSKAASLKDSEKAIDLLYRAQCQGDERAKDLLHTLVLPVEGQTEAVQTALDAIRSYDPFLASRLVLARSFGLTKLEALTVDPVAGLRPWGLVIGQNPFIALGRLSAPRAVPAVSTNALEAAASASALFSQAEGDPLALEGNWRHRTAHLRHTFERHRLNESMFFASASSSFLDTFRLGPKWAFRVKDTLQSALAA